MARAWISVSGTTASWQKHQHVERIVVLGQRLRDEAVVRRVIDGRVEHAIELDQAALLVELVLHARAERDFDDGVELLRQVLAGSDVVPCMSHVVEIRAAARICLSRGHTRLAARAFGKVRSAELRRELL